jgi:predicted dehydrogenase
MNVCLIGVSGHYGYALGGISADGNCEVAGVAPGSPEEDLTPLVNRLRSQGRNPVCFDDYRRMLEELRPDVAVVNCHFADHARVGIEVLKSGCHLFIEKPVAVTEEQLKALRQAYLESGRHLAAMHGLRYHPAFYTAWKAVRNGAVGEIRLIHAQKSYRLGSRPDFYRKRERYGGTIPWVGSHAIDWIRWFSGKTFDSVYASHSKRFNREHGDLEVSALCHFVLEDEVFASASIDYLRPEQAPSHGDDRIRVAGSDGILEVRDGKVWLINQESDGVRELPLEHPGNIFADFLGQIRGEKRCLVSAEDSFYVTEICLKARESADRRIPVRIS